MTLWFGLPHASGFVALSVVMAIFGGYVGLGLAGQARPATGLYRRGLLAGAAWSLGLGIWTMHFVGMLAAHLPDGTLFSVLLTLLSFLLCVLVVGVAAFLVGRGESNRLSTVLASVMMGAGIVSMHYLGMHAVTGNYVLHHDARYILSAAAIAVAASYGALRVFDSGIPRQPLALSAMIFGLAVSGMHYTAMAGTQIVPEPQAAAAFGPSVSSDVLTIVVAFLAFVVSGAFLLYLVPEGGRSSETERAAEPEAANMPPQQRATLVPVESEGATKLIPAGEICAIQATTHYTLIYDGRREYFSPWSITEAESRLDKDHFMRVHRSHLVAVDKVKALRKSGDGAVVEVGAPAARLVPVSRNRYAELKSRLGLHLKVRAHAASQQ
ncbi:MAG: MHYT domain-containing protein [Hyphomicrobiales bacterium]